MTLQQLRLVIETVDSGSISAAAEKLAISQPNASVAIKKLEDELGYSLFLRTGGGISLTGEGYLFLEHAQVLLDEAEALRAIGREENVHRLRVGVMNLTLAIDTFLRFCQENPPGDYTCINVSVETGTKLLSERKLDVVVALYLKEALPMAEKLCSDNHFLLKKQTRLPICVRVASDHPLILDGTLDGSAKGFRKLKDYPCIEYIHLDNVTDQFNQTSPAPFGYSHKMFVDERDTRLRLMQKTNAFTIGCLPSRENLEKYGLAAIPTGTEATLVTIVRKGDEKLKDVAGYLALLAEEAANIR